MVLAGRAQRQPVKTLSILLCTTLSHATCKDICATHAATNVRKRTIAYNRYCIGVSLLRATLHARHAYPLGQRGP